jgi:hypothetical protein
LTYKFFAVNILLPKNGYRTAHPRQDQIDMAFTQSDGENPQLSSAWWKTRCHHAPLGVRTKEYQKLVEAIEEYEKALKKGGGDAPSEGTNKAVKKVGTAAHSLLIASGLSDDRLEAIKEGGLVGPTNWDKSKGLDEGENKNVKKKRGLLINRLPLMGSKKMQDKHMHFKAAVKNLEEQCKKPAIPEMYQV